MLLEVEGVETSVKGIYASMDSGKDALKTQILATELLVLFPRDALMMMHFFIFARFFFYQIQ